MAWPYLEFNYNDVGRGSVYVFDNNKEIFAKQARTGSIDGLGKICNAIPIGRWLVKEKSVDTTEIAMVIPPHDVGWKTRLYKKDGSFSNYLFHPDGNKPGSLGCIVFSDMAEDFRKVLDDLLIENKQIPVFINTKLPQEYRK
jgi:hypothetical protein